jgi:hypothetical protein
MATGDGVGEADGPIDTVEEGTEAEAPTEGVGGLDGEAAIDGDCGEDRAVGAGEPVGRTEAEGTAGVVSVQPPVGAGGLPVHVAMSTTATTGPSLRSTASLWS